MNWGWLAGPGPQSPLWDRLAGLGPPVLVLAGADDARFAAAGLRLARAARPEIREDSALPRPASAVEDALHHRARVPGRPPPVLHQVLGLLRRVTEQVGDGR